MLILFFFSFFGQVWATNLRPVISFPKPLRLRRGQPVYFPPDDIVQKLDHAEV